MRSEQEILNKMREIGVLPELADQYSSGHADGAYSVLQWVLEIDKTFDTDQYSRA